MRAATTSSGMRCATEAFGLGRHDRLFAFRPMVVSDEMQKAVGEKHPDFGLQRAPPFACLTARRLYADHDVAEDFARSIGGGLSSDSFAFTHRKGEDIGGAIAVTEHLVELANLAIVGDDDGELGLGKIDAPEHALRPAANARPSDVAKRPVANGNERGHGRGEKKA